VNSQYVHVLWVVGAGLVFSGLLINQTTGNIVYQLLIANGVLAFMAYLALRGFTTETPKFLAARGKLVFCLWIMVAGALGISMSTILDLSSTLMAAVSPLFWVGGLAFLAGAWAFILLLILSRPAPLSP
jgi:hypothetical protein